MCPEANSFRSIRSFAEFSKRAAVSKLLADIPIRTLDVGNVIMVRFKCL